MAGNQFFRKPTEEEKSDFRDIGPTKVIDAKTLFLRELDQKRIEAAKKKLPFFKKAAMDDFDEYYKEQVKLSVRKNGYVKPEEIKPIEMDWSKYSSPENITFIEINEQRDSAVSKKHPFDVFVKAFRYKYKGYGVEGVYNISVMEDEVYAVKRARAAYENKPELVDISIAEKNSALYGNKEAKSESTSEVETKLTKSKK